MDNDRVDQVTVTVEEHPDGGWIVMGDVDGQRKQFGDVHPDKDKADFHAKHMFDGADRWTGAATETEPDPAKYPGDGDPSQE
jgi:hypothetical protein